MTKIKPCPYCNDSWLYVSDGGYTSGYENKGYKVSCICGNAWTKVPWQKTEEAAIKKWNKVVEGSPMTNGEWLNTLTTEEFVTWLVCDEVFDPKTGKLVEPAPRFPTMKRLITEGCSRQGTIMKINIERFFKEWLEEERKAK